MLRKLFPERIDNHYPGHPVGLWLFVPIALMKLMMAGTHIFVADGGAQSVTTIPLDAYPAGAAQNVIGLMARMGVEQALLGLLFAIALLRYRALVPLMYLTIVLGYLAGMAVADFKPLATAAVSGARLPHLLLMGAAMLGLALSLLGPTGRRPPPSSG